MSNSSQSLEDVIAQLKLWVNVNEPLLVQDGSYLDQRRAGVAHLMQQYYGANTPEGKVFTGLIRTIKERTSEHMVRPLLGDVFVAIHRDRKATALAQSSEQGGQRLAGQQEDAFLGENAQEVVLV
jgi:hypothetical protein